VFYQTNIHKRNPCDSKRVVPHYYNLFVLISKVYSNKFERIQMAGIHYISVRRSTAIHLMNLYFELSGKSGIRVVLMNPQYFRLSTSHVFECAVWSRDKYSTSFFSTLNRRTDGWELELRFITVSSKTLGSLYME
jgi:hypothetical protein